MVFPLLVFVPDIMFAEYSGDYRGNPSHFGFIIEYQGYLKIKLIPERRYSIVSYKLSAQYNLRYLIPQVIASLW